MKKWIFISSILLVFQGFVFGQTWDLSNVKVADSFNEIEEIFQDTDGKLHVINFWATWCKPCVEEMPYVQELMDHFTTEELRLTLVSLDFKKDIDTKYLSFLNDHKLKGDQIVLLDGNYNEWIEKVDEQWSGAIPITLIIKGDQRIFIEESFNETSEILKYINTLN